MWQNVNYPIDNEMVLAINLRYFVMDKRPWGYSPDRRSCVYRSINADPSKTLRCAVGCCFSDRTSDSLCNSTMSITNLNDDAHSAELKHIFNCDLSLLEMLQLRHDWLADTIQDREHTRPECTNMIQKRCNTYKIPYTYMKQRQYRRAYKAMLQNLAKKFNVSWTSVEQVAKALVWKETQNAGPQTV